MTTSDLQSTKVTITFEGLMVFHQNTGSNIWEVGILEGAMDHEFTVSRVPTEGSEDPYFWSQQDIRTFKTDRIWTISVVGQTGNKIEPKENGHPDRFHDDAKYADDFSWIINIEKDFHKMKLARKSNHLYPIIQLNCNGTLRTYCKTDSMVCQQGDAGTLNSFGFVAETIALDVELNKGEKVVMKTSGGAEVFSISYKAGASYRERIQNVPKDESMMMGDHFYFYYDLVFSGVGKNERFKVGRDSNGISPLNRCNTNSSARAKRHGHKFSPFTFYPFRCGGVATEASADSLITDTTVARKTGATKTTTNPTTRGGAKGTSKQSTRRATKSSAEQSTKRAAKKSSTKRGR